MSGWFFANFSGLVFWLTAPANFFIAGADFVFIAGGFDEEDDVVLGMVVNLFSSKKFRFFLAHPLGQASRDFN